MYFRSITENIRKQPSQIEEARAMKAAINNGESVIQVAQRLGVASQTVRNRLKLLELSPAKQQAIHEGKVSATKYLEQNPAASGPVFVGGEAGTSATKRQRVRSIKEVIALREQYSDASLIAYVPDWFLGKHNDNMEPSKEDAKEGAPQPNESIKEAAQSH